MNQTSMMWGVLYSVSECDRIAQLVLARAPQAEVEELSENARGGRGFGSTGK